MLIENDNSLFGDFPAAAQKTLSKKGFAEAIGLTPGRISQLIERGLPVEPNGRIDVEAGRAWYAENVDQNRRKGGDPTAAALTPRGELDKLKIEREKLKLAFDRGQLVDRRAVERVLFGRARAERDRWLGWVSRAAPELASAANCETAAIFGALDRLVREQLRELAEMPAERLLADE